MNLLDYVIVIILGLCLVRGIFRGIIKELSSLVGALSGLYAAYAYYPLVAHPLTRWIADPAHANILACLLLFFGIFMLVGILGVIIKYVMNIAFLGWADRVCGAFLGGIKGVLLVSVLILVLTAFLPKNAEILSTSLSAQSFMRISATLAQAASKDIRTLFSYKMKELSKTWQAKKS
jgi:membrane protein required for colicin V production